MSTVFNFPERWHAAEAPMSPAPITATSQQFVMDRTSNCHSPSNQLPWFQSPPHNLAFPLCNHPDRGSLILAMADRRNETIVITSKTVGVEGRNPAIDSAILALLMCR